MKKAAKNERKGRPKEPDKSHEEFIKAAVELVAVKGIEGFSIDDLLEKTGRSKGGFYHHFDSKLAVLEAICQQRAEELSHRVYEFSEFLVDVLGCADVGAAFPGRLTYHASCHTLRGKGVDRQPRLLLSHVKGAEFVELPGAEECCGFGGLFAIKMSDISGAMLERKMANIRTTGADVVVTCEPSCLINISSGLHRQGKGPQVLHIAQILRPRGGGAAR